MAVLSSARLLTTSRLRLWELVVCKRRTWLSLSVQRCYTSDTSKSSADHLERYKELQRYFKRRLTATYHKFSNIPDHSAVCGHHHVYFVEGDGIYRVDKRQSEPEQVLNLGQVSGQEEKSGVDNEERKPRFHWTVQRIRLSPQEKHLAATLKTNHSEELRCVVVRLGQINSPSPDPPHLVFTLDKVFSFEWVTDEVLFYTTLEDLRCSRVFRLDLTSNGSRITSVYEETHPDVFVEVVLSRNRQILTINCNSRTSSEVLLIDTTSHLKPFLVQPRQQDLLYHVEHWRRWLIILANTGPGQEYQVVQAPLSEPSMVSWVTLFTPGPGTAVKDMDVVGDHCVLVARTPAGELVLIVVSLTHPKEAYTVQLPSWTCAINPKKPDMADQRRLFEFLISSPVHSPVPYCLYPEDGLLLSGTKDGSSPENQGNYTTTRLEAYNQDGTLVPITLFHTVPVEGLKQAPLLAHVYGAYGRDLNMEFSPEKRLLLEKGWAMAYCHIRGGGERGLSWQRQARVEGKQKGVEDLQACLGHLFSLGVSSPSLTALTACSAGAVPVGALCNKHPHMMRAVTLQAPFLDVLGTMEDPSLPLTLEDREEWGDPVGNPKHRLTVSSYCPLHNITPQCYPSILLTAYSGDTRVPLAGVLKYTEQLKNAIHTYITMKPKSECEPAPNIVLNIQSGANHLGPEDFELMLEEEALRLSFLYTELGLDPPQPSRKRKR
ncbi:prolyl endopeptidase-like [Morone saxatilis]|uniref:prolyl endopeptidase-like n=1 Tax=Morone saxatilis TaxID=34816 RepID=UPI0015E2064C|nr:prolyl endopeptidase-like [Morone saxatilis]